MRESSQKPDRPAIVPLCVLLVCLTALVITNFAIATSSTASGRLTVPVATDQVKEIQDYRTWTKVNSTPQFMRGRAATDCTVDLSMVVGSKVIHFDDDRNPHLNKYFTVYVNQIGKKAMDPSRKPGFPVGSVIVKEKLPSRFSQGPELLTVMIKREKGFNKALGDWEFMVTSGTGSEVRARGTLENCQSCHLAMQESDYVFRGYLLDGLETSGK